MTADDATRFLYPFIESDERDEAALLADLAASATAKFEISRDLTASTLTRCTEEIHRAAREMATCFSNGGRMFAFGNGGSATDAEGAVDLFSRPPSGRPLPARSLVADPAILTALANDVGFDLVFTRQLMAYGRPGDIAVGFSTSGDSVNVLRGFDEAERRGMLTVGLSGYGGGAMAAAPSVAHCLVVQSDSVHRIQEAQDALLWALWEAVQGAIQEARG